MVESLDRRALLLVSSLLLLGDAERSDWKSEVSPPVSGMLLSQPMFCSNDEMIDKELSSVDYTMVSIMLSFVNVTMVTDHRCIMVLVLRPDSQDQSFGICLVLDRASFRMA